jgi:hypothetical protein
MRVTQNTLQHTVQHTATQRYRGMTCACGSHICEAATYSATHCNTETPRHDVCMRVTHTVHMRGITPLCVSHACTCTCVYTNRRMQLHVPHAHGTSCGMWWHVQQDCNTLRACLEFVVNRKWWSSIQPYYHDTVTCMCNAVRCSVL